jgi:hypothetical protein
MSSISLYKLPWVSYIIVLELCKMLSLLVLLNDLTAYSALCGVAIASDSMRCDVRGLDHLLAIGTQHRLHFIFIIIIAVLALFHSFRWCPLYLAYAASLCLGIYDKL